MRLIGFWSTLFTAYIWEWLSSGRPGAEKLQKGKLNMQWNDRAFTVLAWLSVIFVAPNYGQGACGTNEVEASADK